MRNIEGSGSRGKIRRELATAIVWTEKMNNLGTSIAKGFGTESPPTKRSQIYAEYLAVANEGKLNKENQGIQRAILVAIGPNSHPNIADPKKPGEPDVNHLITADMRRRMAVDLAEVHYGVLEHGSIEVYLASIRPTRSSNIPERQYKDQFARYMHARRLTFILERTGRIQRPQTQEPPEEYAENLNAPSQTSEEPVAAA